MVKGRRRKTSLRPPADNPPKLNALGTGALWRVHPRAYRAAQFNSSSGGDARFSPLHGSGGDLIPVLYGASSRAGAIMETVFHDTPTPPGDYVLDIETLREQDLVISCIRPKRGRKIVDLSTKGLKRLGLHRTDIIDTSTSAYPLTRQWAEWLHETATEAAGMYWTSRQDDESRAVVLFGDRLTESAFEVEIDREPLIEGEHLDALLELADHIGIAQVFDL